jgi:UDP-N-acetylmuramoylalanine-D-glutamate ligase
MKNLKVDLANKKILILGLGREGLTTYQFLRALFPKKTFGLADQLTHKKLSPEFQKIIKTDHRLKLHLGFAERV